ncbi:MAG: glycosyltransferase family 4 protein [Rhodothermales bacterium]|nr:glycosyltransferase family 4 protein [Rhodothermales bacterium]MBO6779312.1 glycosyltransferase family 4 protein [Rhodothermales bacterium]
MAHFLIVSQDFPPDLGGTQSYGLEIARKLAARHRVTVVAPDRPGAADGDAPEPFETRRTPLGLNPFPLASLPTLRRVYREGVDATLCVQWYSALACQLAGRNSPLGLGAHGRELLFTPYVGPVYNYVRRRTFQSADHIFAVSNFVGGLARGLGVDERRIQIVPNAVDAGHFDPERRAARRGRHGLESEFVLLSACRLVPRKGVHLIVDAVQILAERYPALRLWIVGDGPERKRLQAMVSARSLDQVIRFHGGVPFEDMPGFFEASDAFCMVPLHAPPDVEGFGLVFLEAAAAGIASVGSRAGGIEDAILENHTGLMVPPDDAKSLAEALERLITDAELRDRLAREGRRHALAEGGWERVADTIEAALLG